MVVGAVWAFCVILVVGPVIDEFQGWFGWPRFAETKSRDLGFWFCAVWLFFTTLFAVALRLAGERLLHPRYRVRVDRRR